MANVDKNKAMTWKSLKSYVKMKMEERERVETFRNVAVSQQCYDQFGFAAIHIFL